MTYKKLLLVIIVYLNYFQKGVDFIQFTQSFLQILKVRLFLNKIYSYYKIYSKYYKRIEKELSLTDFLSAIATASFYNKFYILKGIIYHNFQLESSKTN